MTENKAKISSSQLLAVLLVCRLFTLMTFVPFWGEGAEYSTSALAAVISSAVQALLIIPLLLFNKALPETSVTNAAMKKRGPLGFIAAAMYLVFFLFYAVSCSVHFMRFLGARFLENASAAAMALIFTAVCVYCARCGIEGLCRSGTLILVFFAVMVIVMLASSYGNFDAENFYIAENSGGLLSAAAYDLSKNGEIVAAAFLIRHTKARRQGALYGLIGAKLILSELVFAAITGVLGGYAEYTDYPFLEVGTYSGAELFQRNDSLYLILWTLAAVISVSLFISISASLLEETFPRLKFRAALCGAAVFVFSAFLLYNKTFIPPAGGYIFGGAAVIVLAGVVPFIMYFSVKMKGKKGIEKKKI